MFSDSPPTCSKFNCKSEKSANFKRVLKVSHINQPAARRHSEDVGCKKLFLWVHHYELHLPGNTHASFTRRKVHFRCKLLIKSQNLFTTYSKTCLQGTFQTILKTADFVEHDRGSVIPLIHLRAQDRGNTTNQFG